MQRVWFNKTFSSIYSAIRLIREADQDNHYAITCTSTNPHALPFLVAHDYALEPGELKGAAYIEWCLNFCREQAITIFVPGKEASLISGSRALFEAQGTRVLCAATQIVLEGLHNKAHFYQTVELAIAPPPAFRIVETVEQFNSAYEELREDYSQLCIKPSVSVYGLGFSQIDETRNCAQLLMEGAQYRIGLEDLRRGLAAQETFRTMLVMEYLDGHEYSVDCIGDRGALICAIPRKKPRTVGYCQTIDLNPTILEAVKQLTFAYALNGVFNVQFREGQSGLRLLEINPRMSGGIGMACLAGPNLPYLALVGFDRGYQTVTIPPIREGMQVGEAPHALEMI